MSITRYLDPGKAINKPKLQSELNAAGIPAESVGSNEDTNPGEIRIDFLDSSTLAQRTTETDAVIAAHPTATPVQTYSAAFYTNRKVIFNAFYTFGEAFRNASATPSLAQYQAALQSTLDIIDDLPATFTTEFDREVAGQALAAEPASGWTAAQCRAWHTFLGHWLARALAGVAGALVGELD